MAKYELSVDIKSDFAQFISEMPTVKYSVFSFEHGACLLECRCRFFMKCEVSGRNFEGDWFSQMPISI